jgi:glycosyltransferase involved in cell wall biosynthesis
METARALAARGHEVTLLTAGRPVGRFETDGFRLIRYRRWFADSVRHERWFGWRISPHLATGHYDAVHSLMPCDALAAIRTARWGGHRTVYEDMGIPVKAWWSDKPDRRARLEVALRADVYGCMSDFALAILARDHGREGPLIPGGVRTAEFRPAPERERRPTILFSGVLDEPRKGVRTLLDALPLVARREPEVQLWLSGPGAGEALVAAAPPGTAERTELLDVGDVHAQAERYGRAWVTALPSINESFGMALLESLSCGTPIVVADDSAPPELARRGVGTVCRPGDPGSLANALVDGLSLARDPGVVARATAVAAGYDWDTGLAPSLEAIYARR